MGLILQSDSLGTADKKKQPQENNVFLPYTFPKSNSSADWLIAAISASNRWADLSLIRDTVLTETCS
jgi:hypothetical protein